MSKCVRNGNTYKRHNWKPKTVSEKCYRIAISPEEAALLPAGGLPSGGQRWITVRCDGCGVERSAEVISQ